jgi:hypothetical protein
MGRTRWDSEEPGDEIPGDRADEHGDDDKDGEVENLCVKGGDIDDIITDRMGDCRSKKKGADEFAEGCHHQGLLWGKRSRRDDRRDDIGCIVEPVGIVKDQGKKNNEGGKEQDRAFDGNPPMKPSYLSRQVYNGK